MILLVTKSSVVTVTLLPGLDTVVTSTVTLLKGVVWLAVSLPKGVVRLSKSVVSSTV